MEFGGAHAPFTTLIDPPPAARPSTLAGADYFIRIERMRRARYARDFLAGAAAPEPLNIPYSLQKDLELVALRLLRCEHPAQYDSWLHSLHEVAVATTPYLPRDEARALWGRLAMTPCREALPQDQRRWLTLLRAVADGDAASMASGAKDLLENPSPALESRKSRRYLVAAALAAHLAQGERAQARAFWKRYGPSLSERTDIALRLLHAHMHAPQ